MTGYEIYEVIFNYWAHIYIIKIYIYYRLEELRRIWLFLNEFLKIKMNKDIKACQDVVKCAFFFVFLSRITIAETTGLGTGSL